MRELLIITFISSWTPLKGVLAKLSYCSHEKQFRLPVHLGEEKEMVHPKAKATIPPLSFHQDKCLPLQCYQTHTHSHSHGGGSSSLSLMVYCSAGTRHFIMLPKTNG